MKRIFAVILAMMLVGVSPLTMGVASAESQRTGVINTIKFMDANEPDDLSLRIDGVNYSDNIGGYLRHILGTEQGNKFLADQNAVYAQYDSCEDVPKEEYDACEAEANEASAELYLEYKIYPVEIVDIHMMSGGSVFEAEVVSADLSVYLSRVQREYGIVNSAAESMGYDVALEPLVIHKTQDGEYEDVNAKYNDGTNELRFGVDGLSQFMVGFRLVLNEEPDDDDYLQNKLISADNLPQGTKLVIRDADNGMSDLESFSLIYGEGFVDKMIEIDEKLDAVDEDEEAYWRIIAEFYDEYGILFGEPDFLDIFLADINTGEKVSYSGNGITIRYDFGYDYDNELEGLGDFFKYSNRKWSPAIVHIKDDGTREFLPATVKDGVWEFTATSFSMFLPALVAESPSTLDNAYINAGVAMIGIAGLFSLGAWMMKKERR